MKRLIALFLCVSMILAACGKAGEPAANGGQTPAPAQGESPDAALAPIRFSVFAPDSTRKIPPDDAPIVNQVFEKTGVLLDWIVPPAEPQERLNIMLATDDLPDLILFWDATIMKQFIEAGKLLDLEDLMKENAPQAYELNYVGFRDRIRHDDGKMYFLPGYYSFGDAADSLFYPETSTTFTARTGLLEELGWYDPKDFDAIFELLKISKERYPEMSPMALALGPQGHLELMNGIGAGAYGLAYEDSNILLYDGEIKYFTDVPEMKEWYAYLNKIHRAGLLDVESPVMSLEMLKEKLVSGKIFSFFGSGWEPGSEFIAYMESIGSDEQCMWYFFPKANDSVEKTTYARYTEDLHTSGLTLTKNNKDPARFFKFYEYLNTEDGWLSSHGIVNYDFSGENTVENTQGYDFVVLNDRAPIREGMKLVLASEWMGHNWNDDENWWWSRGLENFGAFKYSEGNHPLGLYDYVGDRDVGMWWDDNTKRIYGEYGITGLNYWEIMTETGSDVTLISGLVLEPGTPEAIAQVTMGEYIKTQLPRVIVADTEADFEARWNEMDKKLTADGKDVFVAKKSELYKERLADWGIK